MRFLITLLFFAIFATAQNNTATKTTDKKHLFKNPYEVVYHHLHYLQKNTYDPLESARAFGRPQKQNAQLAIKLKAILDGKGLVVMMERLPRNENYKDTLKGFFSGHRYWLFHKELPDVYVEKVGNAWQYSPTTAQKITTLYSAVYPFPSGWLQEKFALFKTGFFGGVAYWQYFAVLLLFLTATILFWVLQKIFFVLLKAVEKATVHFSYFSLDAYLKKITRPLALLTTTYFVELYFPVLHFPVEINAYFSKGVRFAEVLLLIFIALKIVDALLEIYRSYATKTQSKLDDQLQPILHRLLKVVVWVIGLLNVFVIFGMDIKTILALASVGGLALALASQDTVKNLIGTLMIFMDKPFQIGDWIVTDEVVGTVEEVGLRTTKIRAADTSVYFISNSQLAEIVINNKGLLKYRRYTTKLGIRYDTPPDLIRAFVSGIEKLIIAYPDTNSENFKVAFTGFGDSALEILVNVYFTSTDWGKEQTSKNGLHLVILELANELGVGFAFPSQTLFLEHTPENPLHIKYNTDPIIMKTATEKVISQFD